MTRHSMSVNFDQGSIPVEYDGTHEDLMPKLAAALDDAIGRGWIDEAEKQRHLKFFQDDHEKFLRDGPSVHIECTSSATVAGSLKLACQGYDIKYQNVDGIQHRHDFHYATVDIESAEGTTEATRIMWTRKD